MSMTIVIWTRKHWQLTDIDCVHLYSINRRSFFSSYDDATRRSRRWWWSAKCYKRAPCTCGPFTCSPIYSHHKQLHVYDASFDLSLASFLFTQRLHFQLDLLCSSWLRQHASVYTFRVGVARPHRMMTIYDDDHDDDVDTCGRPISMM